jgi:PhzF family phenazine biosynthesis protein
MSEPILPIVQVDAFTDRPFRGNPAAVCLLPTARPDEWMQAVAAEMNLSETAFLRRLGELGDQRFELRWFTPEVEVDLCGHATLASAHALWESGEVPAREEIRFRSASGELVCERGDDGWIHLDFPALPSVEVEEDGEDGRLRREIAAALGAGSPVELRWLGRSRFDLLAELASEAEVRGLDPDQEALRALGTRGVIVTALAERAAGEGGSEASGDDGAPDFVSRFFCPGVGIPEDPVTGSAHCALAPFWARRLGRDRLTGHQASARGGTVWVELRGDRVRLGGQAVTVLTGELRV